MGVRHVEIDLEHEVGRVSASLLAFDRLAHTLTFRPRGAKPVAIGVDEQTLRNWLQGTLLAADQPATHAYPHERAIELLVRRLQELHEGGQDPFTPFRDRLRAALTPSLDFSSRPRPLELVS